MGALPIYARGEAFLQQLRVQQSRAADGGGVGVVEFELRAVDEQFGEHFATALLGFAARRAQRCQVPGVREQVLVATDAQQAFDRVEQQVRREAAVVVLHALDVRSEEQTYELQSLMRNSYAVSWLIKKIKTMT